MGRQRRFNAQMDAVSNVAKATQPTKGTPALAAAGSIVRASRTYTAPVATIAAAATVLAGKFLRLKKIRLQPPIMATLNAQAIKARLRAALWSWRRSRYAPEAMPVSIANQTKGTTRSAGRQRGLRKAAYQAIVVGLAGAGFAPMLKTSGTT